MSEKQQRGSGDAPLHRGWGGWFIVALAAIVALAGQVEKADNVTHRVLDLVDTVAWGDFFRPFTMPFPINAEAFRPISVVIFKSHVDLFGTGAPPFMVSFAKAFLSVGLFGLAARKWLITVGWGGQATLAAALAMVCGPSLFQVWYYPELDLLGAAATLWVGARLLEKRSPGLLGWLAISLALAFSMLLKEATALIQLAFLGAATLALWEVDRERRNRHIGALTISLLGWGALVVPLLSGPATEVGALPLAQRLSTIEHNLAQIAYLLSPAGALLLLLTPLTGLSWRNPLRRHLGGWAIAATVALVAIPVVTLYSHYEAVYYSPRWFGLTFGATIVVALLLAAVTLRRELPWRISLLTIGVILGGFSLVGVTAPTAREDLASRIFIAAAPLLFAMALKGAAMLRVEFDKRSEGASPLGRVARGATAGLVGAMLWYPAASGFNYTLDYRARHEVDLQGKRTLAQEPVGDRLILFNHYVEWLDPLGLIAAGAPESARDWQMLQVPAQLTMEHYRTARWIHEGGLDLEARLGEGGSYLYWLTPRSLMDERANEALLGDLEWTRKGVGLFSPIHEGGFNRPEDHRATVYSTDRGPLHARYAEASEELWSAESGFVQLPMLLHDLPRRLLAGVPLLERYRYEGALWRGSAR